MTDPYKKRKKLARIGGREFFRPPRKKKMRYTQAIKIDDVFIVEGNPIWMPPLKAPPRTGIIDLSPTYGDGFHLTRYVIMDWEHRVYGVRAAHLRKDNHAWVAIGGKKKLAFFEMRKFKRPYGEMCAARTLILEESPP